MYIIYVEEYKTGKFYVNHTSNVYNAARLVKKYNASAPDDIRYRYCTLNDAYDVYNIPPLDVEE